jgi:ABC-2 type transport system permease protein
MMGKILKVARREYVETLKTKAFLIGVLMAPVIAVALMLVAKMSTRRPAGPQPARSVAAADLTGRLADEIRQAFDAYNEGHADRRITLDAVHAGPDGAEAFAAAQKARVRRGRLDAFVEIEAEALDADGKARIHTRRGTGPADFDMVRTVESLLNRAVFNVRCRAQDLPPDVIRKLTRRLPTEQVSLGAGQGDEKVQKVGDQVASLMIPFFFMFLMFTGIVGMGQHMLSSVIEEKNSRVIEVLLSALSPLELMAGKILGLAGIGLTVVALWSGAAFGVGRWQGIAFAVDPAILPWLALYYVLGFLLVTSILAGIGSVCNTVKEAQSLMMPVMMMFIVPMVAWFPLARDPEGLLARLLSFVPPMTPLIMALRLAASREVPLVDVVATLVVLAASVPLAAWAAARVFRVGILMYGKRPRLREVLRWVRQG